MNPLADIPDDIPVFLHIPIPVADDSGRLFHPGRAAVFSSPAKFARCVDCSVFGPVTVEFQYPRPVLGNNQAQKKFAEDFLGQIPRFRK